MFTYAFRPLIKYPALIHIFFFNKLKGNNCTIGRMLTRRLSIRSKFAPSYFFRFALENVRMMPKEKTKRSPALLAGILTFLGVDRVEEPDLFSYEVIKVTILRLLGLYKPEEESELIMTIKKGILFIKKKQYDKAEQMLHSALAIAEETKDEEGITYIYDILANLAFEVNQYKKAEKLFVAVLQRILAKGEEKNSNKVVEISLKLAKIFENEKDFRKAEHGYKFCIETLDKKLESEDEDTLALWGMSMDWYARFLLGVNRKTEALSALKKAYEMCIKVNGGEHEQTVVLLNDLGTVCSLMGDQDSALEYLEKARDIGMKLPGMKDLASIYINLGQLYLLREMFNESKQACEKGLNIAKSDGDRMGVSEAKHCLEKIKEALGQNQSSKEAKSSA